MPRFFGVISFLSAAFLLAVATGGAQAATQSLALLETEGATPLQCESGICKAEFSTFCLQKERDLPRAGDPYQLAQDNDVTLIVKGADGTTRRLSAAPYIRIAAARSGHTAVTIAVDAMHLKRLGVQSAAIAVGERVSLMPVPVAGDDNPQTDQDRRLARGPLRNLGAQIVDKGPHDVARVHALNRLINVLPDRIDRRADAAQSLWRRAADSAFRNAPAGRVTTARQEYAACWQDPVVALHGYSVRHCLQRRHDSLMWQHVKRYWDAVGAGS